MAAIPRNWTRRRAGPGCPPRFSHPRGRGGRAGAEEGVAWQGGRVGLCPVPPTRLGRGCQTVICRPIAGLHRARPAIPTTRLRSLPGRARRTQSPPPLHWGQTLGEIICFVTRPRLHLELNLHCFIFKFSMLRKGWFLAQCGSGLASTGPDVCQSDRRPGRQASSLHAPSSNFLLWCHNLATSSAVAVVPTTHNSLVYFLLAMIGIIFVGP